MKRFIAMVIMAASAAAAGSPSPTPAPSQVSGRVFLDANGNGTLDAGEKGLPGVRVTDGVGFVTTGADGAYSISIGADPAMPLRSAQTVGVCWPTGMWPSGPWWIRLSRIQNAGAVNFALRTDVQSVPFIYLHMTDPHEYFNTAYTNFATFINALPPEVKFIIDTGDSYRQKSAEAAFNRLFFSTVGNHDTWELPDPPPEGRFGAWTDRLGPMRWSFDHAGIHFVGVDVIEGIKVDPMIDWLEKDLAAVPKGTRIVLNYHYPDLSGPERFTRLLQDNKVEMVHGGHDHAYGWTEGAPSLVRAYHWQPPGTCNIAVVSKDRIDIGVYCIGCKKEDGRHSRRCPMDWANHVLRSGLGANLTKLHTLDAGPLTAPRTVKLTDPHAFIVATIDPAGARRAGLRIGTGESALEVAFTGDRLVIAGTSMPFALRPGQKTLNLTVCAHYNLLTVWANNYLFMEKPVKMVLAGEVSAFAEGGAATLKSMTVQEVKADPDNRNTYYACSCGHGVLRRNPVPR